MRIDESWWQFKLSLSCDCQFTCTVIDSQVLSAILNMFIGKISMTVDESSICHSRLTANSHTFSSTLDCSSTLINFEHVQNFNESCRVLNLNLLCAKSPITKIWLRVGSAVISNRSITITTSWGWGGGGYSGVKRMGWLSEILENYPKKYQAIKICTPQNITPGQKLT